MVLVSRKPASFHPVFNTPLTYTKTFARKRIALLTIVNTTTYDHVKLSLV